MIKYLLAFLLLTPSLLGQTIEDAKRRAKESTGILFLYVSTTNCTPCVQAKKEICAATQLFEHIVVEVDLAQMLMTPGFLEYNTAPQLIMLDVGDVIPDLDKYSTNSVNKLQIQRMLDKIPVSLIEETFLSGLDEPEQVKQETASRVIKYAIATEYKNGLYNSTYNWNKIDHYLQAVERYWDVDYQRVTRGQNLTILQSSRHLGNNVAAVAGGSTIRIAPRFNFYNDETCGVVIVHEDGHILGGSSHNRTNVDGLMGPSGGPRILQSDYYWFRNLKFRQGVPKPHEEPDWFLQWLRQANGEEPKNTSEDTFICPEQN